MRLLFQNPRLALAFVVLIVLGAAAMVGPQGDGGLVSKAVSLSESQRGLLSGGTQGTIGAQQQAKASPSVFGEYNPDTASSAAPTGPAADNGNPMTAPMASTAVVAPPGTASPETFVPDTPVQE